MPATTPRQPEPIRIAAATRPIASIFPPAIACSPSVGLFVVCVGPAIASDFETDAPEDIPESIDGWWSVWTADSISADGSPDEIASFETREEAEQYAAETAGY